MKMNMNKYGKMSSICEFSIWKLGYMEIFMKIWERNEKNYLTISLFNFDHLPDEDGKKSWCQKLDEDERMEEWFDFWILHIKIRWDDNFHENLWKKMFYLFLGHFWLIEAKMKMKMKNSGKWVRFFNSPYQS